MRKKSASAVSIIGGADGPTSVFIAGKRKKPKLSERIKRACYIKKKKRIEKGITADPHTLDEVVQYLRNKYHAVELSQESYVYMAERKSLKESLITKHKPELLGAMPELTKEDEKSLREFMQQLELRSQKATAVPDEIFPMDFHIYEIKHAQTGHLHISIETIRETLSMSYSAPSKGAMKRLKDISKDICLYYGVSAEDIRQKSERYSFLVSLLCS